MHSPRRALGQSTRLFAAATGHRSAARVGASFSAPFFCPKNAISDCEQIASVCTPARFESTCAFCCSSTRPEHPSARNIDAAGTRHTCTMQNGRFHSNTANRPPKREQFSSVCEPARIDSTFVFSCSSASPELELTTARSSDAASQRNTRRQVDSRPFSAPQNQAAKPYFRPRADLECVRARQI